MSRSRVGVIVLDFGRPEDTDRAGASAQAGPTDVRLLIVENGSSADAPTDHGYLRLPENLGFAGGMNAGLKQLLAEGCDPLLLLNNDAVLEPGCLQRLADALEDPMLAAVGPTILRESDGRIESRGVSLDLRWGRVRLERHGETPTESDTVTPAPALSGAAMMISRRGLERVGLLDESYFFSFEDLDWCVRARRSGFGLAVVPRASARHFGGRTIGRRSPDRLYYAARNHILFVEKHQPLQGVARLLRRAVVVGLNLALATRQGEVPRLPAMRAVLEGATDASRGRHGPRRSR
jgi:GT2 family glycosyltransferase